MVLPLLLLLLLVLLLLQEGLESLLHALDGAAVLEGYLRHVEDAQPAPADAALLRRRDEARHQRQPLRTKARSLQE